MIVLLILLLCWWATAATYDWGDTSSTSLFKLTYGKCSDRCATTKTCLFPTREECTSCVDGCTSYLDTLKACVVAAEIPPWFDYYGSCKYYHCEFPSLQMYGGFCSTSIPICNRNTQTCESDTWCTTPSRWNQHDWCLSNGEGAHCVVDNNFANGACYHYCRGKKGESAKNHPGCLDADTYCVDRGGDTASTISESSSWDDGWSCEYMCNTKYANEPGVCNDHGSCDASEICTCDDAWAGDEWCTQCGAGYCPSGSCDQRTCYDICPDHPDACSGHGVCTGLDTCECYEGWIGSQCNVVSCPTIVELYEDEYLPWTWWDGSSSKDVWNMYKGEPGSRYATVVETIDRRVFMFGGTGRGSTGSIGHLEDVWEYSHTSYSWALVTGDTTVDQSPSYGSKGVYSA